jgi:hypothetical protein
MDYFFLTSLNIYKPRTKGVLKKVFFSLGRTYVRTYVRTSYEVGAENRINQYNFLLYTLEHIIKK